MGILLVSAYLLEYQDIAYYYPVNTNLFGIVKNCGVCMVLYISSLAMESFSFDHKRRGFATVTNLDVWCSVLQGNQIAKIQEKPQFFVGGTMRTTISCACDAQLLLW